MKKKFLSLMMAAAVVATTSVSAFASTTVVNSPDDQEAQSPIEITGKVQDNTGKDPVGTFKVTVPTTAEFTVTKDGNVMGPTLEVSNAGSQEIEVYAYKFVDKSGSGKIDVIKEDTILDALDSTPNTKVSLKLVGANGDGTAYLASDNSGNGVYDDSQLTQKAQGSGVKVLRLQGGSEQTPVSGRISLEGRAGKEAVTAAVQDEFTLTLKIKKPDNSQK